MLEIMVVMAIIVILAAVAIPTLSGLTRVSSEGATRTALRSLFASARSMAANKQCYVGVRFQQAKDGRTYAVLLVPPKESPESFPHGCPNYAVDCLFLTLVAVENSEPVLLPRGVELAGADRLASEADPDSLVLWQPADAAPNITDARSYVPATTFTVVFSPSGQIVRKPVHVAQRRDGWKEHPPDTWNRTWTDPVFNFAGLGLFSPDVIDDKQTTVASVDSDPDPQELEDGPNKGGRKGPDKAVYYMSQSSIWVYERDKRLEQTGLDAATCKPFSQYIQRAGSLISLNVYTGAPVNTQQ